MDGGDSRSHSRTGHAAEDRLDLKDKDGEYYPEARTGRRPVAELVDSQTKLQTLMDQIDTLTHSLSAFSQAQAPQLSGSKRLQRKENEDEKDLVSEDPSLYTVKMTAQPASITGGEMRDYQLEGLNWMLKIHACGINGILADEMGLGKTLQTISLLAELAAREQAARPHIVIVPKSTLANWTKEFRRWAPTIQTFEFYGNAAEREQLRPKVARTDTYQVLMTTYETAINEKTVLKAVKWSYLVIDEAHRIKNEKSVLSQLVRLFSSQHRLLITGTPLQNNLHELWALLNFLMPQLFGSAGDFDEWFDLRTATQDAQEFLVKQLHLILKPFMLRRLKRDVETKLPEKREIYVFLGMSEMQRELYKSVLSKNIHIVNGFGERSQLLNTIMQLRKVCNHPYLFDGVEQGPPYVDGDHLIEACMKFKFLDKLLPRLLAMDSKILIFTQMTRLLDIMDDFLAFRGYRYYRIDGSTPYLSREMQIEAFQKDTSEAKIFLLSTRAGGLGINLHTANVVIIYDSDWNPQVDIQAMDRAHRIGQTREVSVYRFITEGTVEEKIAERAAKKLKMDHLVIQKGALSAQNKTPSVQEMNLIVQFGAQQVMQATGRPEEDVERILQYAQDKTQALNKELAKLEDKFNLANFAISDSLYEFEGEDYKKATRMTLDIGNRERRTTGFYDEEKLQKASKSKPKGWRALANGGYPHQFFDIEELDRLDKKEEDWNAYSEEKRVKRTRGEADSKPEKFTEKDKQYRKQLLSQGFVTWSKRDLNSFIKGCTLYGRDNFAPIAEEIGNKSEKEVKCYAKVFWERYLELQHGRDYLHRIEEGEKQIQKLNHIEGVVASLKRRKIDNFHITPTQEYTPQEDEFLASTLIRLGYSNWDDMRDEIKTNSAFRFNIGFQARTEEDLQRRCDEIVAELETEMVEDVEMKEEGIEEKSS
jgi:SWI/SNF-related matrix-associated actin-dependent regulator of chromatin subfamily A member 5